MVRKETCPVCKGNKVVSIERSGGRADWRTCPGCNGAGFHVRMVHGAGLPLVPGTYGPTRG